MPEKILKYAGVFALIGLIAGCASVKKNYETTAYIDTKPRVDQDINGNAGYLFGTPPPEAKEPPAKKTRQVFVVEVTKNPQEEEESSETSVAGAPAPELQSPAPAPGAVSASSAQPPPTLTSSAPAPAAPTPVPAVAQSSTSTATAPSTTAPASESTFTPVQLPTTYKVTQNDTLQTIAKKFYNSYSKWPKIYEANKDKIPDPNRIRNGIILTIPALE